jgi:uncharacterized protein YeaO (DUF488 family)
MVLLLGTVTVATHYETWRCDDGSSRRSGASLLFIVPISVVRLGSPRTPGEGLRLGTVRRPPRGVPKAQFAKRDFYDVWLPLLSPSQGLVTFVQRSRYQRAWKTFQRKFRAEMNRADAARVLDLLAALSRETNFSVGCYCEDEERCHRSILRELLAERGAEFS